LAREGNDYRDRDRGGDRDYRRQGGDFRREGSDPRRDFERELRRLKKDFQRNVLPAVKRHSFYVSKSEMKRIKERKAARRRRRQLRKFGE
jgi:ribosomal protein S21